MIILTGIPLAHREKASIQSELQDVRKPQDIFAVIATTAERSFEMKIIIFYFDGCPYCRNAKLALEDLLGENPEYSKVDLEWVNEKKDPERSRQYDYYYVPTIFVGEEKVYEAHPGDDYAFIKKNVKAALDKAMAGA